VTRRLPAPDVAGRRALPLGFTLIELMVVILILGTVLLLVPANLGGFGARSRLDTTANTLAAAMTGAREQSIQDGAPVRLQLGWYKTQDGESHQGYRWLVTNVPAAGSELTNDDPEKRRETMVARAREREWITLPWRAFDAGLRVTGVSEAAGQWNKIQESEPYEIWFLPDGTVQKGFAVRVESLDLEVPRERRTMTIIMNGLTAESSVEEGDAELPQKLDARDFR
jgi:prepilin-type N-terminal cleavage/methylation domain-containing protein